MPLTEEHAEGRAWALRALRTTLVRQAPLSPGPEWVAAALRAMTAPEIVQALDWVDAASLPARTRWCASVACLHEELTLVMFTLVVCT